MTPQAVAAVSTGLRKFRRFHVTPDRLIIGLLAVEGRSPGEMVPDRFLWPARRANPSSSSLTEGERLAQWAEDKRDSCDTSTWKN